MTVYKLQELNGRTVGQEKAVLSIVGFKPCILLVYMNGCGPCQLLRPEWDKAAKSAKAISIIEVESLVARHIVHEHKDSILGKLLANVSGYPTIMTVPKIDVKNNRIDPVQYTGERTASKLLAFMVGEKPKKKLVKSS